MAALMVGSITAIPVTISCHFKPYLRFSLKRLSDCLQPAAFKSTPQIPKMEPAWRVAQVLYRRLRSLLPRLTETSLVPPPPFTAFRSPYAGEFFGLRCQILRRFLGLHAS